MDYYLPDLFVRLPSHKCHSRPRGPKNQDSELLGRYNRLLSLLKAKCISPQTRSLVEGALASCIEASRRKHKDHRYYFLKRSATDETLLAQKQLQRDLEHQQEREQVQLLRFIQFLRRYGAYGGFSDQKWKDLVAHVDRKLQDGFVGMLPETSWKEVYDTIVDEEIDESRTIHSDTCCKKGCQGPFWKRLGRFSNYFYHLAKHCMLSWDSTKLAMMEYVADKDVSLKNPPHTRSWMSVASNLAQDKEEFQNIILPAYRHLETELWSALHNFERTYFTSMSAKKDWRTGRMEVTCFQCNLPTQSMVRMHASVDNYRKQKQAAVDEYRKALDPLAKEREDLLNYALLLSCEKLVLEAAHEGAQFGKGA